MKHCPIICMKSLRKANAASSRIADFRAETRKRIIRECEDSCKYQTARTALQSDVL